MTGKKEKADVLRRMLHTAAEVRVRESGQGDGQDGRIICGYAVLFGVESDALWSDSECEGREVIDAGAISKELLDGCDIKFTMFHDRQLILARSNKGEGTLSYSVDERGVAFEFEAPRTADGDKALELVRRGDLSGCSFAFSTRYGDEGCVGRETRIENGRTVIVYHVRAIERVYDFTLAADPAYPATEVEAREGLRLLRENMAEPGVRDEADEEGARRRMREQLREMRAAAGRGLF